MASDEAKPGFWTSMTGVITAVAGLLTAGAGLLVAPYQVGVIGSDSSATDEPSAGMSSAIASTSNGLSRNDDGPGAALAGTWRGAAEGPDADTTGYSDAVGVLERTG